MRSKQKKNLIGTLTVLAAAGVIALIGHFSPELLTALSQTAQLSPQTATVSQGELAVHYIDVGQADCILIKAPEKNVLIDAGDRGMGDLIEQYLQAQSVSQIDLLIATHPHADHIGSMDYIVKNFDIGKILFGNVPQAILPTSRTYENLLDAISDKGMKITKATPGDVYDLGGGANLTILAPLAGYDDLNDTSVVTRLDFGNRHFLFTGDAESESEADIVKAYAAPELECDVLKLGHHGSSTSSSQGFLQLVSPKIAIACCGTDNSYGHPHRETLTSLANMGVTLYRTDQNGSIVIVTDGESLDVTCEKKQAA